MLCIAKSVSISFNISIKTNEETLKEMDIDFAEQINDSDSDSETTFCILIFFKKKRKKIDE